MTVETLVHLIDGLQAVKYVWSVWIFNFPRVQMEHKNRHNKKHKDNDEHAVCIMWDEEHNATHKVYSTQLQCLCIYESIVPNLYISN